VACAARDLEGDNHAGPLRETAHFRAVLDDFRDALMADRDRAPNGRTTESLLDAPIDDASGCSQTQPAGKRVADQQIVHVATRCRDRAHERLVGTLQARLADVAPFEPAGAYSRKLLHRKGLEGAAGQKEVRTLLLE
jgi:hypothetical protein